VTSKPSDRTASDHDVLDDALIDAVVKCRSESAARQLVDRHSPRLLAIVSRILAADVAAAEDVLQQSWVKGIEALPRFRRTARFSTWMTRIAVRAAIDHLRCRQWVEDVDTDAADVDLAAPPDDIDGRLDAEQLIMRLPAGCRAVLVLHDIEGFTHEEIAASLGIAAGTSKAHLFRARRLLRAWHTRGTEQEARP
jgi:RNA polymerase sigma-70 factor (ECF subfamily)